MYVNRKNSLESMESHGCYSWNGFANMLFDLDGSILPVEKKDLTSEDSFKWDVFEHNALYTITAELPGLDSKDINIIIEKNELTISAFKFNTTIDDNGNYHYKERSCGRFTRSIYLKKEINEDTITAVYNNGILTIIINKIPPKQIRIDTECEHKKMV